METPIQVEDHIPYLWVRVASQCEGQVSQSPMAMRPNKVGVDKGNGRNHIERYTHTPIYLYIRHVIYYIRTYIHIVHRWVNITARLNITAKNNSQSISHQQTNQSNRSINQWNESINKSNQIKSIKSSPIQSHSKAPWPYSKGYHSALHRSEAAWLRTSSKKHWGSPKWKILVIF